jgi:hypothetical protein
MTTSGPCQQAAEADCKLYLGEAGERTHSIEYRRPRCERSKRRPPATRADA